jgi:hypothetical protein
VQYGGPGNAGLYTGVYLTWTRDSNPVEILGFAEGGAALPRGSRLNLTMRWANPSHLIVSYNGRAASLYLQVVKCDGIHISVQDLSSGPNNDNNSK